MFDGFTLERVDVGEAVPRARPSPSGHHMAEEAPDALAAELLAFLAGPG